MSKRMPVQNEKINSIPEEVYMAAYEVYCHVHTPQPRLVEGNCRGGFGTGEVIAFLYARSFPKNEWRDRSNAFFKANSE